MSEPFWERDEIVERFAVREPDHRLARIVEEYRDPASVRVLDLGCAGGRNTVLLARRGFDFSAIDSSAAMIGRTRERVAAIVGEEAAARRVRPGRMTELGAGVSFDLVVALGVYHQASTEEEWRRALAETARVLVPGGRVLVAVFTDESDPGGTGLVPVAGAPRVFLRDSGERNYLVPAEVLDADMARNGLLPAVPTETVRRPTEAGGVRVTANALYAKGR
jgi:SAM-dependent methyltransferase